MPLASKRRHHMQRRLPGRLIKGTAHRLAINRHNPSPSRAQPVKKSAKTSAKATRIKQAEQARERVMARQATGKR